MDLSLVDRTICLHFEQEYDRNIWVWIFQTLKQIALQNYTGSIFNFQIQNSQINHQPTTPAIYASYAKL